MQTIYSVLLKLNKGNNMTFEIRLLDIEEAIKILHFLSSYAFTPSPPLPEFENFAERIRSKEGANYYAVFSDNEPQAVSCETTPLNQNLRGKSFKMAGVANVASHPAARRKGYVRKLMLHMYREFNQKGYAVSCLYPFKESFYQRLGYITLPQSKKIIFSANNLEPVLKLNNQGAYDLVAFKNGYDAFRSFTEKYQAKTHGMALFAIPQQNAAKFHQAWLVFAKRNDEIVGVMNYTLKDNMMNQTLTAYDFLYTDPHGKFLLLNWIARHIDQVEKVILTLKPDQAGENLYTDLRPEFEGVFFPPMARVINIAALSGLPIGNGKISFQVEDPDCEWNNGVWTFESVDGQLAITKAKKADFMLSIHGLTALVYGVYDPAEFILRGWGNPNPEHQQILREMFPRAIPYLHAMY
jgi:predicted acetyltransferase